MVMFPGGAAEGLAQARVNELERTLRAPITHRVAVDNEVALLRHVGPVVRQRAAAARWLGARLVRLGERLQGEAAPKAVPTA